MSLYVPLHVRSAFSLGRGTASVDALVKRAAGYGHDALALTDRNNLYGLIPFLTACDAAGVRPIVGAEVDGPEGVAVVLVEDAAGYANLCRLITRRMLHPRFALVPALAAFHGGNHVLVANPTLLRALARVVPRDRLWAELSAPHHGSPVFGDIFAAARDLGLSTVATGEVNGVERNEHRLHATLTAVRKNTLVGRLEPGDLAPREAYFKAPAAMASIFRAHRDALDNTRRLAERCRYIPRREGWIFPDPPLPPDRTAVEHLRGLCEAGLLRRYGRRLPAAVRRLERELAVIEQLRFTTYFVVVGEIMRFAREQGIASVGRGSGASALTAYVLGITNVDPLRYGLYFERFLHGKREDCPDLDIDLCWIRRDEVIDHVYATYGRDRVAMISTHNTYQSRSAVREAAKAHGVAHAALNRMCRGVPHYALPPLRRALDAAPRGHLIPQDESPWPRALDDADRMVGLPRHLGLHPGGMVISDRPLETYVPLEEATKGILCTQFEMRAIEKVGLVKIDLLGNRALSTIQETVELVEARTGTRLEPDRFSHRDPAAAALLSSGDTLGVFQMESPAMRNLNRMLKTQNLDTAIAAVALIRPGPAGSGMKERFVRRLQGDEAVDYADPRLERVLGETFGIPLYEEHVMCLAAEVAGISLEDGDVLRRAIAARNPHTRPEMEAVFLKRARARGYRDAAARDIWETLLRFGAFAFCKAHAAGYGVLAWQSAWLKAHHPAEFACAIMNHHAGMYDKRAHLEDAKRHGVRVLLPDIHRSEDGFTMEDGALRVGLEWVQRLSAAVRENIYRQREARPFVGVDDFLYRVPTARAEVEALILAGAFDFTGEARSRLLCRLASGFDLLRRRGREAGLSGDAGSGGLFAADASIAPRTPWEVPALPPFSPAEQVWQEWSVLGLCPGQHPMRFFREHDPVNGTLLVRAAEGQVGRRVRVAGIVAARRTVETRAGKRMQFVTLEDESGMVECTLFPNAYGRHRGEVNTLGPFLAEGRMEEQHGARNLNVERIRRVAAPAAWSEAGMVRGEGENHLAVLG